MALDDPPPMTATAGAGLTPRPNAATGTRDGETGDNRVVGGIGDSRYESFRRFLGDENRAGGVGEGGAGGISGGNSKNILIDDDAIDGGACGVGDRKGEIRAVVLNEDPIRLSLSTHSFLFTEPTNSLPFAYAVVVMAMSYTCLSLVLVNNLEESSPRNPLNVRDSVSISFSCCNQ